jgi:hypothetical protein
MVPVTNYPCTDEFATSPAVTTVSIMMGSNAIVRNAKGVTVMDVVKRCAKMWASKPPMEVAEQVAEDMMGWDPDATSESVTWLDTLGDHRFWEGMQSAIVAKPDWVRLRPQWFGS